MGPLSGIRIIEAGGIGPAPFATMLLADLGAEVVVVHRPGSELPPVTEVLLRSKTGVEIDYKKPEGRMALLSLADRCDILIEGFRPGVMERLGLGPAEVLERNPKVIYGRVTGWGQEGAYAQAPGHDLNYIALTGLLHALGDADRPPPPPLNLIGDFAGGSMLLVMGILAALHERHQSGKGQVIDAAIVDGVGAMMNMFQGWVQGQTWGTARQAHFLDGAAPFYGVYRTADGKYFSIGAIEEKFYQNVCQMLGLSDVAKTRQWDKTVWPQVKQEIADKIATKTRDEWAAIFSTGEYCAAPVLDIIEAAAHEHAQSRKTYTTVAGVVQAAPVPRFSRSRLETPRPPVAAAESIEDILRRWREQGACTGSAA